MSQGPLCPNLSQKVQKEVSQMANCNLSPVILLGGLSVNLNHLKMKYKLLECLQQNLGDSPCFRDSLCKMPQYSSSKIVGCNWRAVRAFICIVLWKLQPNSTCTEDVPTILVCWAFTSVWQMVTRHDVYSSWSSLKRGWRTDTCVTAAGLRASNSRNTSVWPESIRLGTRRVVTATRSVTVMEYYFYLWAGTIDKYTKH